MLKIYKYFQMIIFFALLIAMGLGVLAMLGKGNEEPPTAEAAPWSVQLYSTDQWHVPTRIYYAKQVQMLKDKTPVLVDYWSYDGERYKFHGGKKPLPEDKYGKITIVRRK